MFILPGKVHIDSLIEIRDYRFKNAMENSNYTLAMANLKMGINLRIAKIKDKHCQ